VGIALRVSSINCFLFVGIALRASYINLVSELAIFATAFVFSFPFSSFLVIQQKKKKRKENSKPRTLNCGCCLCSCHPETADQHRRPPPSTRPFESTTTTHLPTSAASRNPRCPNSRSIPQIHSKLISFLHYPLNFV